MLFRRDFLRNASAAVLAPAVLLRAQTATAQSGRTVRVGVVSPLSAFDPIRFSEAFIMRAVFPPLTRITTRTGDPLLGWEPYAGTPSRKPVGKPALYRHYADAHTHLAPARATILMTVRGIERARQLLRTIDIVDTSRN